MDVQTRLLPKGSGTKDPDHRDLLHRTGPEVRVAYIQVLGGWTSVGLNGHDATAESTGREGGDRGGESRGGGATMSRAHRLELGVIIIFSQPCSQLRFQQNRYTASIFIVSTDRVPAGWVGRHVLTGYERVNYFPPKARQIQILIYKKNLAIYPDHMCTSIYTIDNPSTSL